LAELIGHVDDRNRPIVPLSIPGLEDAVLALVDTGFNGQILVNASDVDHLRFSAFDSREEVELADREQHVLVRGQGDIIWFGRPQRVYVFIAEAERPRAALPDEPVAMLGTALLSPHRLTVDFATRRVVIVEHES
jgi:predicted aspartyl protease